MQPARSSPSMVGPDRQRWPVLAVILVAAFMNLLDAGIVFLALPHIQHDLHATYAALRWMAAGYTLAFALVLIAAGRLGDILGRSGCSWSAWPASPSPPGSAPLLRAQPC
jgi:MFS family permease